MNTKSARLKFSIPLLIVAVVLGAYCPLSAQRKAGPSLDIVVKISKLEKNLNLVDKLIQVDPGNPFGSPTFLLRGMLQGTGWIDPSRLIVIGVKLTDAQPEQAALLPFKQVNEKFRTVYNASAGPDYYLVPLPPGKGGSISKATEADLVAASRSKAKAFVAVELAAGRLLSTAKGQVEEGLNKIQGLPNEQGPQGFGLTPQEMKDTLSNLLDTLGQLETLELALDLSKEKLSASVEAKAARGTKLAKVFTQPAKTSMLDGYKPKHHINFRNRSSDVEAMVELINDSFGKVYEKIGIDFSRIATICTGFTGETAGGMSYHKDGMSLEMIGVLKDPKSAPDFLEKVFVPWTIDYGKDVAKMMERQLGKRIAPLHARIPDTKVAGHKVVGIKAQTPFSFMPTGVSQPHDMDRLMKYEMRMTTVGNLLLIAPNNRRIGQLIKVAKSLKERPSKGPFMTLDIDLGAYVASMMEMMPGVAPSTQPLPQMDRVTLVADLEDGRASAKWSIRVDDIKTLTAHFKNMAPPTGPAIKPAKVTAQMAPEEKEESQEELPGAKEKKELRKKEDSAYWFEKGAICATYGNDKAAIRYFKKAIEPSPDSSDTHFHLGVSYGQIGEYENAIASIDKALELGIRKGLYLYGRGRVYLLSGDKDKATEDFKQAATLGNTDAQDYLQNIAHVQWQ